MDGVASTEDNSDLLSRNVDKYVAVCQRRYDKSKHGDRVVSVDAECAGMGRGALARTAADGWRGSRLNERSPVYAGAVGGEALLKPHENRLFIKELAGTTRRCVAVLVYDDKCKRI